MVSENAVITNTLGLHGRPANRFVKEANKFASDITIQKGTVECSAKSIVRLLTAHIRCNDEIVITCSGLDEREALAHLVSFIQSGCGEQENQ